MKNIILSCAALMTTISAAYASGFQSPSGNVHCFIDSDYGAYARCDIMEVDREPRQTRRCELDYGHAFGVDDVSRGAALCVGDTVFDKRNPVLNYGSSISQSGITCASEKDGMSCENEQGHGFTLSRKNQKAY